MGAPRTIPTGTRFGRLVLVETRLPGMTNVRVRCDCGTVKEVIVNNLGKSARSCGCERLRKTVERSTKHGGATFPEYKVWQQMRQRCHNPGHPRFADYGGRGIRVCDRWLDFGTFIADMGRRPGPGYSIERIDNDRGYQPDNCRWIPDKEQALNRRPIDLSVRTRDAAGRLVANL